MDKIGWAAEREALRSEDPTTDAADRISEAAGGRCFRRARHIEYSHRRRGRREFAGRRTAICRKESLPVAESRAFPKEPIGRSCATPRCWRLSCVGETIGELRLDGQFHSQTPRTVA